MRTIPSRQFDADRAALLKALPEGGVVGVLECATHSGDAARVLELAHAAPYIHAAIGIHPESLIRGGRRHRGCLSWGLACRAGRHAPLFEDKAVVAVGEIGLDHHRPVPREEQYALFEAQLQLAKELTCRCRSTTARPTPKWASCCAEPRGALHCYSGSAEDAVWLVEQGLYLGFGGAVT